MAVDDRAAGEPSELLARAAAQLRDQDDPGWSLVGDRVLAAARSAARRSRPVAGTYPDGGQGLHVADLVVRRLVRRELETVPGVRPSSVRVELAGDVLVRLEARVGVLYGTDALVAGEAARAVASRVLDEVLGADRPGAASCSVDVVVTDVHPAG